MASKIYTAQEMREAAVSPTYVGGVSEVRVKPEVYEMLEQAADMVERREAEIAKLPYPPNADDVYMFKRLNYILRGDARKERRDDNRRKDNRVNLHGCFDV